MRNLARINNYYNNIEARKDWQTISQRAINAGMGDEVKALEPANLDAATWRSIDRRIAKLREKAQMKGVQL